jgi:outer membrane protein TolC
MLEVYQAHQRYEQAQAELKVLDEQVMPEAVTAVKQTQTAFREGDVSYLVVLQASRQLLDSRMRRHQLHGELRRAWAELERSVAQHIVCDSSPEPVEGIPVEEIPAGMESAEDEEQPLTCIIEAPSPG